MKQHLKTICGQVRRYEAPTDKNPRSVDIGGTAFVATVEYDREALEYLARKAALNKTGKAKSGPVTVTITKREIIP